MNWYRVRFAKAGKKLKPVELAAHDASDALYCAGVKAGLAKDGADEDGEFEVLDIECIDDPEHVQLAKRLRQNAHRGFADLSERLGEIIGRGSRSEDA